VAKPFNALQKEVDIKEHLKQWDCLDLRSTAMILDLMDKLGHEVNYWKVHVNLHVGNQPQRNHNHRDSEDGH